MKNRAHFIPFAALCLCALPFSGLAAEQGEASSTPRPTTVRVVAIVEAAAAASSFQSPQFSLNYTLSKATGSDALYACKAGCRKAYRRCYSQGNQIGKPYVTGGRPCSEQKLMCMRACAQ